MEIKKIMNIFQIVELIDNILKIIYYNFLNKIYFNNLILMKSEIN